MLESVIIELRERFKMGDKADALVSHTLAEAVNVSAGGLPAFLQQFRDAGLGDRVDAWIDGKDAHLDAREVEKALGGGRILKRLAMEANLLPGITAGMVGYLLPRLMPMLLTATQANGGALPDWVKPNLPYGGAALRAPSAPPAARQTMARIDASAARPAPATPPEPDGPETLPVFEADDDLEAMLNAEVDEEELAQAHATLEGPAAEDLHAPVLVPPTRPAPAPAAAGAPTGVTAASAAASQPKTPVPKPVAAQEQPLIFPDIPDTAPPPPVRSGGGWAWAMGLAAVGIAGLVGVWQLHPEWLGLAAPGSILAPKVAPAPQPPAAPGAAPAAKPTAQSAPAPAQLPATAGHDGPAAAPSAAPSVAPPVASPVAPSGTSQVAPQVAPAPSAPAVAPVPPEPRAEPKAVAKPEPAKPAAKPEPPKTAAKTPPKPDPKAKDARQASKIEIKTQSRPEPRSQPSRSEPTPEPRTAASPERDGTAFQASPDRQSAPGPQTPAASATAGRPAAQPPAEASKAVDAFNSNPVTFSNSSASIPAESAERLDKVARALRQLPPGSKVQVTGFADSQGDQASNRMLSLERAEAVRAYLVNRGVNEDSLSITGSGAPARSDSDSDEARARNRRIQINVAPQ